MIINLVKLIMSLEKERDMIPMENLQKSIPIMMWKLLMNNSRKRKFNRILEISKKVELISTNTKEMWKNSEKISIVTFQLLIPETPKNIKQINSKLIL